VESCSSVGQLKRNEQPLFRGDSPDFVNLLLCQHVAKLARTPRGVQTGKRGCGFHSATLNGTGIPITTQDDDLAETPRHDRNTFAVRLDSRRLRQVAQSKVGRRDKSILMPVPIFLQAAALECDSDIGLTFEPRPLPVRAVAPTANCYAATLTMLTTCLQLEYFLLSEGARRLLCI
jgi:hypothetical protein